MPYIPIAPSEVDAKSPIDDSLMGKIKNDLDFLNAQLVGGKSFIQWGVNGPLRRLQVFRRPIGETPAYDEFFPTTLRVSMRKSGISGEVGLDVRVATPTNTPIIGIDHQYNQLTQSIGNIAPALATQSITRTTGQISTQSITLAKANLNILSIVRTEGTNQWRLNVDVLPDIDWQNAIGQRVITASTTLPANSGNFVITEVNQDGNPSIVITNAAGATQLAAAGSVQLQLFSYNQTNPVSPEFVAGESALFASHTLPADNGTFPIYKVNEGGNNIWIFIATGAIQAGVAGTVDVQRFQYNFSVAASVDDFIIGERAKMASHTTGANNGNHIIVGVNNGGNNIQVYNAAGVIQGGVAGNVNTNRWTYSLPTDPSTDIQVGTVLQLEGHTNALNNGRFEAVEVKRSGLNNIVIYNEAGVAQGGAAGSVRTANKVIKFASDQAAIYSVGDYVDLIGTESGLYLPAAGRAPFKILEVNRGGGANYNIVFEAFGAPLYASQRGSIATRYRSLFNTTPVIPAQTIGNAPKRNLYAEFSDFVVGSVPSGARLTLFVTSMHLGDARDLTVNLQ